MSYIADMDAHNSLASLQAASCTYRIALGARAGQKVLSLRTLPDRAEKAAAALHLLCFHGVLAPHAKLRAAVVLGPLGNTSEPAHEYAHGTPARTGWARLLKRVFDIDIELPGLWRRAEDYRRHRRACSDCQNPHAPRLAGTRPAALPGTSPVALPSGLILEVTMLLQRA